MSILDDLMDKFTEDLDAMLVYDARYSQASATLNKFFETRLTPDQADELNDLVGKLTSAIFHAASKSGMKLGAKIATGLLND